MYKIGLNHIEKFCVRRFYVFFCGPVWVFLRQFRYGQSRLLYSALNKVKLSLTLELRSVIIDTDY